MLIKYVVTNYQKTYNFTNYRVASPEKIYELPFREFIEKFLGKHDNALQIMDLHGTHIVISDPYPLVAYDFFELSKSSVNRLYRYLHAQLKE
jgi:ABC-type proline/glycine betaine transport system ATPase subunit